MLFRAGDMAQKLFYLYRRELFDKGFKKIEHQGSDMTLYEDEYGDDNGLSPAQALEQCLVPFSDELFNEKRDQEAVLAFNSCSDILTYLRLPLSIILKGTPESRAYLPFRS